MMTSLEDEAESVEALLALPDSDFDAAVMRVALSRSHRGALMSSELARKAQGSGMTFALVPVFDGQRFDEVVTAVGRSIFRLIERRELLPAYADHDVPLRIA